MCQSEPADLHYQRYVALAILWLLPFAAVAQTGQMILTWTPPTKNTNGTPLTDLAGYKVYWGTAQGVYPNAVAVNNPGATGHTLSQLQPATYFSVVTAVNRAGVESAFSNAASKVIEPVPGAVLNLEISIPGVGYRFVRWTVTGRRAPTATFGNAVQIADFELTRAGASLAWATGTSASNPGGSNPGGEGPPNLVDADAATKVLDFNFSSSSTSLTGSSVFMVTMPASREFDGYRFRTANDAPERDPVSWTLEGSEDGSTWKRLAQQTNVAVPTARGAWTTTFASAP